MKGPDGVDIPPTGKSFDLELCTIARWENGQIAEESIFVDVALMMTQIGLGA